MTPELMSLINHVKETNGTLSRQDTLTEYIRPFENILRKGSIFIFYKEYLSQAKYIKVIHKYKKGLHISKDVVSKEHLGFLFHKGMPWIQDLNDVIR